MKNTAEKSRNKDAVLNSAGKNRRGFVIYPSEMSENAGSEIDIDLGN